MDPAIAPIQLSEGSHVTEVRSVAQAVARARKIAVVCGAGISCAAGIPDFRSSEGLFKTLKDRNPKAGLSSGKDLFDASLFQSEQSTALFYQMISELRAVADAAQPTAFHHLLKQLDNLGKLFRVYTQNIDGLEQKAGLTFGLDAVGKPPAPVAGVKRKKPTLKKRSSSSSLSSLSPSESDDTSSSTPSESSSAPSSVVPSKAPSVAGRRGPMTAAACRVVPLHGSMHTASCTKCHYRMPLERHHLEQLASGMAVGCPECSAVDETRKVASVRTRGIGVMRVDVVLYNEEHTDALRIGEITQRDLMGPRPDLLLVVGTSLKVPGLKRLVRELAKVVQPAERRPNEVRAVYLNLWEPPAEFKGCFDAWIKEDVQETTLVISEELAKKAAKAEQAAHRLVQRTLAFPVLKAAPKAANGKKAKKQAPKPQLPKPAPVPKPKPGFDVVEMVDRNVFREELVDLPPRRAKLNHLAIPSRVAVARSVEAPIQASVKPVPGPVVPIPPPNMPYSAPFKPFSVPVPMVAGPIVEQSLGAVAHAPLPTANHMTSFFGSVKGPLPASKVE